MSDDDEKADGADCGNCARHSDPHRYPKQSKTHAGGLTLWVKRGSVLPNRADPPRALFRWRRTWLIRISAFATLDAED
jgi:hypothetical protein